MLTVKTQTLLVKNMLAVKLKLKLKIFLVIADHGKLGNIGLLLMVCSSGAHQISIFCQGHVLKLLSFFLWDMVIYRCDSAVLSGVTLMLFTCTTWLKLVSYAHTSYDMRAIAQSSTKVMHKASTFSSFLFHFPLFMVY